MERVEAGVAGVGGGEGGRNLVKYQVFQLRTLPVGIREAEREKIQRKGSWRRMREVLALLKP